MINWKVESGDKLTYYSWRQLMPVNELFTVESSSGENESVYYKTLHMFCDLFNIKYSDFYNQSAICVEKKNKWTRFYIFFADGTLIISTDSEETGLYGYYDILEQVIP